MVTRRKLLTLVGAALSSLGLFGYVLFTDNSAPPTDAHVTINETATESLSGSGTNQQYSRPGVVDIRDFGAKGDGVTDDSGAIQAALAAASSGDTVFIPRTEDSYLLSFRGTGNEAAIELGDENDYSGVTIEGESAARDAQVLQVQPGSYDPSSTNWILKLAGNQVYEGLTIRNLTLDGARPEDDKPAGLGGEDSTKGVQLVHGDANGGHDITFENVLVRNTSSTAFRFNQSGVTCRDVTAFRAGRHGFNPVASDTVADPGFVGHRIKAISCDGTGIDHRRGTARLVDVYTEDNRSGNKWKHLVERLEVINHHSKRDRNRGWRSNHSSDADSETPPEQQEIVFDGVFVEDPEIGGIRISGTDTKVYFDFRRVEVRGPRVEAQQAGVDILRGAESIEPGTGHVAVGNTTGGKGLYVGDNAVLNIDTFDQWKNVEGGYEVDPQGQFIFKHQRTIDPGANIFRTPERGDVGAFSDSAGASNEA